MSAFWWVLGCIAGYGAIARLVVYPLLGWYQGQRLDADKRRGARELAQILATAWPVALPVLGLLLVFEALGWFNRRALQGWTFDTTFEAAQRRRLKG